jgi:DNA primase
VIKPDTIQNILDAVRIEEVINDFVPLKKRGVNYLGLCPFHNEKTPSFVVSPSKGIFKCFGCGKSGNAVGFIMEHEHYSYPEALKYLANKYGIEVEEEEMTPEMKEEFDERERMFLLNGFMSEHFQKNLLETEDGKAIGLTYLKERGFLEATIKKFQLGYAANAWEEYSGYALRNGYKKDILVKTGLSIEKDGKLIDRFKGRVIFPIHNLTGKVIGFGGRILTSEKKTAKYLNSPESEIYNKSKSLYGIYFAKSAIAKADNCYLVEGYTDVISLHQAGIENVVASSGTSLTVEQIKLIKRFTNNITILYDGDTAGIKASFRGIDLILEQGMNVKIVLFPEGEDPDSYVRSHRKSEIDEFITKQSSDFITFKTKLLLEETVGDPGKKAELIKEIVLSVSKIPDGITRNVYIKECSAVMDIPEQTLMNELNKLLRQKYRTRLKKRDIPEVDVEETVDKEKLRQIEIDPFGTRNIEKEVLRLALLYGNRIINVTSIDIETNETVVTETDVSSYIVNEIKDDKIKFENEVYQKIIDIISEKVSKKQPVSEKEFINMEDDEIASAVIDVLATPYELSKNWEKHKIFVETEESDLSNTVVKTVLSLRVKNILREIKKLQENLKNETDHAKQQIIMMEIFALKNVAINIDNELKRVFSY